VLRTVGLPSIQLPPFRRTLTTAETCREQPAEEGSKGALAMLDDGLMERFPFDEIYGLHNMPGLPVGDFETRPGPSQFLKPICPPSGAHSISASNIDPLIAMLS
jgi:hypothetical protein